MPVAAAAGECEVVLAGERIIVSVKTENGTTVTVVPSVVTAEFASFRRASRWARAAIAETPARSARP
jgi:hypothetical protein